MPIKKAKKIKMRPKLKTNVKRGRIVYICSLCKRLASMTFDNWDFTEYHVSNRRKCEKQSHFKQIKYELR